MNFGELQAQFEGLLKRRDMTPTQSATFLQQAVTRVQRVLRIPPMETSVIVTYDGVTFTNGELPIPSNYLRLIAMTATGPDGEEHEVKAKDLSTVMIARRDGNTGCPRSFTRRGSVWTFGPSPVAGTVFRIDYYDEFGALVVAGDTNYLTEAAADLIIYGALSYAGDWFVDKRAPSWEARFQAIKAEIEDQAAQDALINAVSSAAYYFPEF